MIDYCWQCGGQLTDFSNAGNFYQSAQPTQNYNQGANYDPRWQGQNFGGYQNNYAPRYQPRPTETNWGRVALVLGSFFLFLFLVSGVGAAVVYKIFAKPSIKPREEYISRNPEPVKPVEPVKTAPSPEVPKTVKTNTADVKFEKMWVDYNVKEDGRLGMRIHVKFSADNLKDIDSYLVVHFEKADGARLLTSNKKFASKDGQVSAYRSIKPGYDETVYKDLDVFMPYEELKLDYGKFDLKMDVDVIYENGDLIEHMNYYDFQYEKTRK